MKDKQIVWHDYKGQHVGICEDQVVCLISPMENMPCESYHMQTFGDVFVSIESAKRGAEEFFDRYFTDTKKPKSLGMLESVLLAVGKVVQEHTSETLKDVETKGLNVTA